MPTLSVMRCSLVQRGCCVIMPSDVSPRKKLHTHTQVGLRGGLTAIPKWTLHNPTDPFCCQPRTKNPHEFKIPHTIALATPMLFGCLRTWGEKNSHRCVSIEGCLSSQHTECDSVSPREDFSSGSVRDSSVSQVEFVRTNLREATPKWQSA